MEKGYSGADAPTLGATPGSTPEAFDRAAVPAKIGRYAIEGTIGRGGMATVYLAVDEALQRRVALKLVRAPASRPEDRARMLREAQSMAQLVHPNVVQVFDTGEHGEHIFIAMELVEGPNLAVWCREGARSLAEITAAFAQLARALAAVHAQGLVHRDFKPHNAVVGSDGRVRLIDFGLARGSDRQVSREAESSSGADASFASGEQPSRSDALTEAGLVLGTPAYMSPEQCRGLEVGPASDQFSFCVALFEAAYGQRPFRAETHRELVKRICAGEVAIPVGRSVPAWLERIVRCGLKVDPHERFASMDALAARLEGGGRRSLTLVAGLVATVGLAATAWAIVDAPDGRCDGDPTLGGAWTPDARAALHEALLASGAPYAEETWSRVDATLDRQVEGWLAARRETCDATATLDARTVDTRLACLDRVGADTRAAIEMLAQAEAAEVERAHRLVAALEAPTTCVEPSAQPRDDIPPERQAELDALLHDLSRSVSLRRLGRTDEAAAIARAVGERAHELGWPWLETKALLSLGFAQYQGKDVQGARTTLEQAYHRARDHGFGVLAAEAAIEVADLVIDQSEFDTAQRWLKHGEAELARLEDADRQRAVLLDAQARLHHYQGRYDAAEATFDEALEVLGRVHGEDSEAVARTLDHLGSTYEAQGEFAAAVEAHRRALAIFERVDGPRHPEAGRAWTNLGNALSRIGRKREAVDAYDASYDILVDAYGDDHRIIASVLVGRGSARLAEGDIEDAHADLTRALAIYEAQRPGDDASRGIALNNLGNVELARKDPEAAERYFHRAYEIYVASLGASHPDTAVAMLNLARVAGEKGDTAVAIERYEAALVKAREAYGDAHPYVGMGLNNLARQQLDAGQLDAAERNYRDSLAIAEGSVEPDDPRVTYPKLGLARVALARGEHATAIAGFESLLRQWEGTATPTSEEAEARLHLAMALAQTGRDGARVRTLAEEARRAYAEREQPEMVAKAQALLD